MLMHTTRKQRSRENYVSQHERVLRPEQLPSTSISHWQTFPNLVIFQVAVRSRSSLRQQE
jgi:hypothetical protein